MPVASNVLSNWKLESQRKIHNTSPLSFRSQIIQEMPPKNSTLPARCGCKMVLDTEGRQITMAGASALAFGVPAADAAVYV